MRKKKKKKKKKNQLQLKKKLNGGAQTESCGERAKTEKN